MIRITKREAKSLFYAGKSIALVACKMRVGKPWYPECHISSQRYLDEVREDDNAWDLMYNNWAYYNTSNEQGYYAHYYKDS